MKSAKLRSAIVHMNENAGFVEGMRNESTSICEEKTTFDLNP